MSRSARGRGRRNLKQILHGAQGQHRSQSHDLEIRSWVKTKTLMLNCLCYPNTPGKVILILKGVKFSYQIQKTILFIHPNWDVNTLKSKWYQWKWERYHLIMVGRIHQRRICTAYSKKFTLVNRKRIYKRNRKRIYLCGGLS